MNKSHVHPGDVVAAVKTLLGRRAALVDYQVHKATANVQGFMSCILRVSATCTVGDDPLIREVSFIVKRMPLLQVQQAITQQLKVFDQEAAFFTKCLPLMRRKCPDLKVVECLFTHSASTIVMEDLNQKGYHTFYKNMEDWKTKDIPLELIRLVMRELAKFHASSQGIDWLELMPDFLAKDIAFEVGGGQAFKNIISGGMLNCVIPIMEHIHKKNLNFIKKYTDWLRKFDENVVPVLFKLVKPNSRHLSTLCHGDCWVNNIMVRMDPETQQPLDLRFIDMQVMRYGPVYSDLQYFLYISTKRSFRFAHLDTVLRTYVDAFNAYANVTPDLLTFENFKEGFEETRLCGAILAISIRSLGFFGDVAPLDGQELTEENFLNLLGSGTGVSEEKQRNAIKTFEQDDLFRKVMEECISDLTEQMDKHFCVKN